MSSWPEQLDGKNHPYLLGLFVFSDRLFGSLGLMQYTTVTPENRADILENLHGASILII